MPIMRILFIGIALVFVSNSTIAQKFLTKSLERGVEAHRRYNLISSDSILYRVLQRKDDLTKLQYGEAYYFYNRNLLRLALDEGSEDQGFGKIQVQLKLFRVYNNFLELERAEIPRWSVKSGPEIQNMYPSLLSAAIECLEIYVQDKSRGQEMKMLVEGYTNLAATIMSDGYTPIELKGQLYYIEGDTSKAIEYYELAIEKYKAKRLLMVDNIRIPNVYYLLALNAMNESYEKAYRLARQGFRLNEIEWETIKANANKLGENVIEENKATYFFNLYHLGLLELETAMIVGNKDSLLQLYAEREKYYQDVYSVQMNYAELLRKVNPRESSIHYQKAIDIAPDNFEAYYAMATLYFDLGYYYLDLAKEDKANAKAHKEQAYQLLSVGLGNMIDAHSIDPSNKMILKWIIKVYWDVGDKSNSKIYQTKLDEL